MQEERRAWARVAGHVPGTPRHDKAAWFAWVECVGKSDIARRRVQAEILTSQSGIPTPMVSTPAVRKSTPIVPSRPVPLSEARGTNRRFMTMLRKAGYQWSQFQTNLLRLGPDAFSGVNFIVTVSCARLGLSRTYDAAHESGWLSDFQQDLKDGVFSNGNASVRVTRGPPLKSRT